MATRLYLVATTAPSVSPAFDAGWTSTVGARRRMMATAQAAATEQVTSDIGATGPAYTLSGQFVSLPLAAQTITGTITITSRGRESAAAANVNKRARSVRVYSGDGATLRGTLNAWAATTSTTELSATTLQGQIHATGAALTSVTCQAGDVLVVELGYGVGTSGTTPQATMEWGGVGTDHANTNADTTGTVPWVEFSQDLVFQSAGSTVSGTALAALSFTAGATGTREVAGTAAAALAFTAAAAGTRAVAGAAATTIPFGATAVGMRSVLAQAATPLSVAATASGVRTVNGAAAAPLAFGASAVGQVTPGASTVAGAATAALLFAASASGVRTVVGQAAVPLAVTAAADGAVSTPGAVVARPDIGATVRPAAGATGRPDAGVVTRATASTVRPHTGTVTRP